MTPNAPQVEWSFRQPDNEAADDDALFAALARLLWERMKKRKESTPESDREADDK